MRHPQIALKAPQRTRELVARPTLDNPSPPPSMPSHREGAGGGAGSAPGPGGGSGSGFATTSGVPASARNPVVKRTFAPAPQAKEGRTKTVVVASPTGESDPEDWWDAVLSAEPQQNVDQEPSSSIRAKDKVARSGNDLDAPLSREQPSTNKESCCKDSAATLDTIAPPAASRSGPTPDGNENSVRHALGSSTARATEKDAADMVVPVLEPRTEYGDS